MDSPFHLPDTNDTGEMKESLEHYQIYRSGNILFLFQTRFFFKHSFEGNRKKEFLQ